MQVTTNLRAAVRLAHAVGDGPTLLRSVGLIPTSDEVAESESAEAKRRLQLAWPFCNELDSLSFIMARYCVEMEKDPDAEDEYAARALTVRYFNYFRSFSLAALGILLEDKRLVAACPVL